MCIVYYNMHLIHLQYLQYRNFKMHFIYLLLYHKGSLTETELLNSEMCLYSRQVNLYGSRSSLTSSPTTKSSPSSTLSMQMWVFSHFFVVCSSLSISTYQCHDLIYVHMPQNHYKLKSFQNQKWQSSLSVVFSHL